jgi:hypothetical protein
MKTRFYFLAIFGYLSVFAVLPAISRPVDYELAKTAASFKLISLQKSAVPTLIDHPNLFLDSGGNTLFYIFELSPTGYIAISGTTDLPPVPAYSLTNSAGALDDEGNLLIRLLKADLSNRVKNICNLPQEIIQKRKDEWEVIMTDNTINKIYQQWPPAGTTSTGGWLETNWTQDGVYDDMCPLDPITNQRSLAGCPATAMAQILNYFETVNGTYFSDNDDYYHNYAGRTYWIDNDYRERDFPSFPVLNAHLDTITLCYANYGTLKNPGKAALTFASGVAAHQVYTSQGSGTFAVNQAKEAYLRFGFSGISFFEGTDTSLYSTLSQNMMDARPAHLAIVDPGWASGHNVVVDGYNTNEYYHLNFGWGGAYNGWYLLPDEIPYGLTVIEGLIADIAFPPLHTGVNNYLHEHKDLIFDIYPNPISDQLTIAITTGKSTDVEIGIYDMKGTMLLSIPVKQLGPGSYIETMHIPDKGASKLAKGLYICKLRADEKVMTRRFVIQ